MVDRARLESSLYAALRIVAGVLFAFHGAQKFGLFSGGWTADVGSQLWVGGWIELVGGALIALGLFARPAAFLCAGQMAVAYIQFHWKLHIDRDLLPTNNGGEPAVLFCFIFLLIAARGAGILSLDRLRYRNGSAT